MDAAKLREIPLFARLSADEAAALAELLEQRSVAPNEPLFWIGDPGHDFWVIQKGRVRLTYPNHSGAEMTLATLNAGDFLGEIALLDGGSRTATARAVGELTALILSREHFHGFIERHPSSAIHMMTVLGRRQRETVERLRGIRNANEVVEEAETTWQSVARTIAAAASSQWFVLGHATAFGGWILANLLLGGHAIDPFPFFALADLATVEALFLAMFILTSQNAQSKKERVRADIEYQTALKMQFEIMQLHQKLDQVNEEKRET
jgi:CRP/FNR family transcriptional regulator, cyclic AMP receptor protein